MSANVKTMWTGKRKKSSRITAKSNKKAKVDEPVKVAKPSAKDKLVKAVLCSPSCTKKCHFCQMSRPPELEQLGTSELYSMDDPVHGMNYLHYFCLLFSSEGEQLGGDEDGLLGFLLPSVRSELSRGKRIFCRFCKKAGATISCKARGCKASFHFPCGSKAGCLYQFTGNYTSYCPQHKGSQAATHPSPSPDLDCVVCFEPVVKKCTEAGRLACPGCGRNFHSTCLQRMALASGSRCFKCPHCNNSDTFLAGMRMAGVYVPDKDADWEGKENSSFYNYEDLYRQSKTCSNSVCLAGTRDEHKLGTKWEIILCDFCGLNGVHIECEGLDIHKPDFSCVDCKEPLDKLARQDWVTCLAYNVDNSVVKLGRLPDNTPSIVIKVDFKGKKEVFSRISSKVNKYKDTEGVVLVSCLKCNETVPWLFLHNMESHLKNCIKDENSPSTKYPSFVAISRDESLDKTSYRCDKCVKVFDYQSWFEKHLKIVHGWQNTGKPSPPPSDGAPRKQTPSTPPTRQQTTSSPLTWQQTPLPPDNRQQTPLPPTSRQQAPSSLYSEKQSLSPRTSLSKNPDDDDSSSSEDDETIRAVIKKSQNPGPSHGGPSARRLYKPSQIFDLSELELDLTMAMFATKDKFQLVVFIGDISNEERRIVFKLWKHLDQQIATGHSYKCYQCDSYFAERWQLSSHLSSSCTQLFSQFFKTIFPSFDKLDLLPQFHFYKEKVYSFFGQEYCLLCGKSPVTTKTLNLEDTVSKKSVEESLQTHLINFHLKKEMLLDCQPPMYSCKILNCNSTFPSCSPFLQHLAKTHFRVNQLLHKATAVSDLPGTQSVRDYANPFTQEHYKCKTCGKKTISKASLLIHMVEHKLVNLESGLNCSEKKCSFHARYSDIAVARHYGLKHLQLESSDTEVVDLDSSDEEDNVPDNNPEVAIKILEKVVDLESSDEEETIVPLTQVPGIKILESCSIDVSVFQRSSSETHKPSVDAKSSSIPHMTKVDTKVVQLDDSDDDIPLPIIKFKKVPMPLQGSFVCPFCTSASREEATLLAHLVSNHFREKLSFMVPSGVSPFACPKPMCSFRHKTREGVGDHLGRRHREVVVKLVREIFPDFSFSKHKTDKAISTSNIDQDIIIDDEIVVLGETSKIQHSQFVSCEIVPEEGQTRHESDSTRAKTRPVVLPSGTSVDLANSPHARIAPMVQYRRQGRVLPLNDK